MMMDWGRGDDISSQFAVLESAFWMNSSYISEAEDFILSNSILRQDPCRSPKKSKKVKRLESQFGSDELAVFFGSFGVFMNNCAELPKSKYQSGK